MLNDLFIINYKITIPIYTPTQVSISCSEERLKFLIPFRKYMNEFVDEFRKNMNRIQPNFRKLVNTRRPSCASDYGIDISDIRYLQTEGSMRDLTDQELDKITDVWVTQLYKEELGDPRKIFDFFGYTPADYQCLEDNILHILKKKKAEPIKRHLINGLCNIIYKHLQNSLFWCYEEGFNTHKGVERGIEELKRKTNTNFNYTLEGKPLFFVGVDLKKGTEKMESVSVSPDHVEIDWDSFKTYNKT